MNQPDRIDKFVVPEGVKKVSYEPDTKIANAGTFTIQREDHTIGNLIRMKLHEDSRVLFAGYKIVHPLEHKVLVKVQTDGSIPPSEAFSDAIDDLGRQFSALRDNFAAEFSKFLPDQPASQLGQGPFEEMAVDDAPAEQGHALYTLSRGHSGM